MVEPQRRERHLALPRLAVAQDQQAFCGYAFRRHFTAQHADTLTGSKHANMKELRCNAADGVWRIAFAFDPDRQAIPLVGGDKSGVSEKRFHRQLIARADERFDRHLAKRKG